MKVPSREARSLSRAPKGDGPNHVRRHGERNDMERIDLVASRKNGRPTHSESGGWHVRIDSSSREVVGKLRVGGVDGIHALRMTPTKPRLPV